MILTNGFYLSLVGNPEIQDQKYWFWKKVRFIGNVCT